MDAVFPFVSLLSLHVSALQFCHSLELTAAKESVRISGKLMFLFHFFLFKACTVLLGILFTKVYYTLGSLRGIQRLVWHAK